MYPLVLPVPAGLVSNKVPDVTDVLSQNSIVQSPVPKANADCPPKFKKSPVPSKYPDPEFGKVVNENGDKLAARASPLAVTVKLFVLTSVIHVGRLVGLLPDNINVVRLKYGS